MKRLITLLLLSFSIFSMAQENRIEEIRTQFNYINSQKEYQTFFLENNDYIDHVDMGITATAFFKNDTLFKVIEKAYFNYYNSTTEYYYWDNELFFVYTVENNYEVILDEDSSFLEFNYDKQYESFTGRYYYENGKEIKRIEKGESYSSVKQEINAESLRYEFLNITENYETYLLLQGEWIEKKNESNSLKFNKRLVEVNNSKTQDYHHFTVINSVIFIGWDNDETHSNEYRIKKINSTELVLVQEATKKKKKYIKQKDSLPVTRLFYEQQ